MTKLFNTSVALGFVIGLAIGSAIYGGLGLWIAGIPGLACGLLTAAVFSGIGLVQMRRFARQMAAFEAIDQQLTAELYDAPF